MLKRILRNFRTLVLCLPWRLAADMGFWRGEGAPVHIVIEKADWAIRWVGEHIRDEIEISSPGNVQTSMKPQRVARRIVHFGSQYMWLDWGRHMSRSNQFVTSFFHGKPEDGADVAKYIDQFLVSVPRLSMIVTASSLVEKRLLDWGVPRAKLVRIPIGVDARNFIIPSPEQRAVSRERFGIPNGMVVVGSFQKDGLGWGDGMEPKLIKGPDIFVETLVALKAAGVSVMAFLTGPSRGYIKQALESHGIPFFHKYVTGHLELVACYHALDLYLVTSREEGGPMGLMESMASGVPVVSTKVGMAPDLVIDGVTGGLSAEVTSEAIAYKAFFLLTQSLADRNVLVQSARKAVMVADWRVVSRRHWEEVYRPLIHG
jgi:glycosyltransferase involved in cell wall biosynthesis